MKEDNYLLISGIQHFYFCRRQWALIHIENQWVDNYHTSKGEVFHENAHNGLHSEKRGDIVITRGMDIVSSELMITGVCDVVEFHRTNNGVNIFGREGKWLPIPIEYKKGKEKLNECDELQLCAQAVCLEQMLCCNVKMGYLYYGEPRTRVSVSIDISLREKLFNVIYEMHELYKKKYTPNVKPSKSCNSCSLREICLPKLQYKTNVKKYIDDGIGGIQL